MLKPQDVVLLIKLISNHDCLHWKQKKLAEHLCISVSEINACIKRLVASRLLIHTLDNIGNIHDQTAKRYRIVVGACEEFLIYGAKYCFPAELGEVTRGIPTACKNEFVWPYTAFGHKFVWAYAEGTQRGMSLKPLYPSVPKSVSLFPDSGFYNVLCLFDTLRCEKARERELARTILRRIINPKQKD